jgi:hypothetical protein
MSDNASGVAGKFGMGWLIGNLRIGARFDAAHIDQSSGGMIHFRI